MHHSFAKLCCRPFRKIRKPHRPVQGSDLRSTSQLGKTSAGGFVGCVFLPPAWLRVLFWFQRAWGCCKVGMELFGPEQRVLSMGLSRCQPPTGRQGVCAGPRGTVLDVWKAVPAAYGAASYDLARSPSSRLLMTFPSPAPCSGFSCFAACVFLCRSDRSQAACRPGIL